jgi:hypothetical protein
MDLSLVAIVGEKDQVFLFFWQIRAMEEESISFAPVNVRPLLAQNLQLIAPFTFGFQSIHNSINRSE